MANSLSQVRLDYMTIKPYLSLKNLLIIAGVCVILSFSTQSPTMIVSMVIMYGTLISINTFAVGEKNGIDTLYATLALSRRQVVFGRYWFCYLFDLVWAALALALSAICGLVFSFEINWPETLLVAALCFILFVTLQNIQLPMFFKLGYTRARFMSYIPLLGLPASVMLFGRLTEKPFMQSFLGFITAHVGVAVAGGVGIFLLICAGSMLLSSRFYAKRDF